MLICANAANVPFVFIRPVMGDCWSPIWSPEQIQLENAQFLYRDIQIFARAVRGSTHKAPVALGPSQPILHVQMLQLPRHCYPVSGQTLV